MDSAMIASLLSYGNIAIKLAVGLIGFLWVLRTTNRCQLAQMTPVDLIGNFVMGGIIGGVIYNQDITTVQFIIVLAIWQLLVLGVNALRIHTESGQKMIVGRPTPVVIKGKYLQDKFELLGLDIADFATLSRIQGVHSLYDIWNAQIEPNGQATIQKKDARKILIEYFYRDACGTTSVYANASDLFFFFKQKTAYEISACLVGSATWSFTAAVSISYCSVEIISLTRAIMRGWSSRLRACAESRIDAVPPKILR